MRERRTPEEIARYCEELEKVNEQMAEDNRRLTDERFAAMRAELEALKAAAAHGSSKNVKGSATRALTPYLELIREATKLGTPITQQKLMLERSGITVSYNSLRKFIQKHLRAEYLEFLANNRTLGTPDPDIERDVLEHAEELNKTPSTGNQRELGEQNNSKREIKKSENISDLKAISGSDVDTSNYEQAIRRNE